jgi:hypothetical protein
MTSTVRIRAETREALRELESLTGERVPDLLARAVEHLRRSLILAATDAAYARLREAPEALADLEAERREWDATLTDGLEDE